MRSKRSRVHPPYKTKYRVTNWPDYDRALTNRGSLTLWISPDAIANWNPKPIGRRGGQAKYSDLAIETALTLRLLFHLPYRQVEGFLRSLFTIGGIELDVPDHTTLSRRASALKISLKRPLAIGPIVLAIDSSGLAVVGQGQWAAARCGERGARGWRKIHVGVDQRGMILAEALTDSGGDDAQMGCELMGQAPQEIDAVIGDKAYDTRDFYAVAAERGASVIVPPIKTASLGGRPSAERSRTIQQVTRFGRQRWKKETGYHRQAKAENAFFRLKTIIGDRLRSRSLRAQCVEATVACNILNWMATLGMPRSVAIGV